MKTEKIIAEIYKNNKRVLDFIFDNKPDWVVETATIFRDLLREKGAKTASETQNTYLEFYYGGIENYSGHYFQINVKDLSLVCRKDLTHNRFPSYKLYGDKTDTKIQDISENLVFDREALQKECKDAIERIFAKDGIIEKWLADIKKQA